MKAVVFHGIGDIRLDTVPEPKLKERTDAIVRLTASAICGTDLHFVRGTFPGVKEGTILGHEGVGIVEEVGKIAPDAKLQGEQWKPGDAPSLVSTWAVKTLAKAGTLGIIGVYPPKDEFFPIGATMNKNLSINMGNCNHRTYIPKLVAKAASDATDPTCVLSQVEPMQDAIEAYKQFDLRRPGWIKVELKPGS